MTDYIYYNSTSTSTISAASLVVNDVIAALDNKQHCAALFVDLSKAFDTVDHHHLLLHKLSLIGFDHMSLQWFNSYLTGRSQCVKVGKITFFRYWQGGTPRLCPWAFTFYNIYQWKSLHTHSTFSGSSGWHSSVYWLCYK